jgi:hypothetical protein
MLNNSRPPTYEVGSTQRYEEEIRDRSAVLGAKARSNLLCAIPEKATYARGSPNEAVARGDWSSCNSFTASQESVDWAEGRASCKPMVEAGQQPRGQRRE